MDWIERFGVPRFFLDANVRFPTRPVIAEGLLVRAVPRGLGIDVQGGPRRFILRGAKAVDAFDALRTLLDGKRTLPDILPVLPDGIPASTVLDVLKLLHQRGVLVDADATAHDTDVRMPTGAPTHAPHTMAIQFWHRKFSATRSVASATELTHRLASACITVVASGLVGELTIELLERSGCAAMTCLRLDRPASTQPELNMVDLPYAPSRDGLVTFLTDLREAVTAADLLVVAVHGVHRVFAEEVNDLVQGSRTPLLFATEDGETGEIMFVEPRRSACLACRTLRQNLTSDFALEDYLFSSDERDAVQWRPHALPAGESITAAALIAAHTCGEAVRYVTAVSGLMFVNATLTIDLMTGMSRVQPVLRVPRCDACGSAPLFTALEISPATVP